mgnify:CR=1 FL=1
MRQSDEVKRCDKATRRSDDAKRCTLAAEAKPALTLPSLYPHLP